MESVELWDIFPAEGWTLSVGAPKLAVWAERLRREDRGQSADQACACVGGPG